MDDFHFIAEKFPFNLNRLLSFCRCFTRSILCISKNDRHFLNHLLLIKFEQFSSESRKWFVIALVMLYFALWLAQKTRAFFSTNQIQTWANYDLVACIFPCFKKFWCFYFESSLALKGIFLSFDWLFWLIWFWVYDAQSKSALCVTIFY